MRSWERVKGLYDSTRARGRATGTESNGGKPRRALPLKGRGLRRCMTRSANRIAKRSARSMTLQERRLTAPESTRAGTRGGDDLQTYNAQAKMPSFVAPASQDPMQQATARSTGAICTRTRQTSLYSMETHRVTEFAGCNRHSTCLYSAPSKRQACISD